MNRQDLLTAALAAEAVELVWPAIEKMIETGVAKRPHFYIVVRDPTNAATESRHTILLEVPYGNFGEWEYPYGKFALGKSLVAFRCRHDNGYILDHNPTEMREGDPLFRGGVFMKDDEIEVVVGVSGVDEEIDEGIARMIGSMIIALVKLRGEKPANPFPDDESWVGDKGNIKATNS